MSSSYAPVAVLAVALAAVVYTATTAASDDNAPDRRSTAAGTTSGQTAPSAAAPIGEGVPTAVGDSAYPGPLPADEGQSGSRGGATDIFADEQGEQRRSGDQQ
jgi:hypothetical protein